MEQQERRTEPGDDLDDLRVRLAEHERLWAAAADRLDAFARLEALAEAEATTPEALARRAAVAQADARLARLEAEAAAAGATCDQATRRLGDLEREIDRLQAEHRRCSADLDLVEGELAALLQSRDQRGQEIAELTQSRDELYIEVAELLEGLEDLHREGALPPPPTASAAIRASTLSDADRLDFADDDSSAFQQFFSADIEHDKSREWILGGVEAPRSG